MVTVSGLSGLTKAYKSVLSAVGSWLMNGASRWLEASTKDIGNPNPRISVAAVNSEIPCFIACSSLLNEPKTQSGGEPHSWPPGVLADHDKKRVNRLYASRRFSSTPIDGSAIFPAGVICSLSMRCTRRDRRGEISQKGTAAAGGPPARVVRKAKRTIASRLTHRVAIAHAPVPGRLCRDSLYDGSYCPVHARRPRGGRRAHSLDRGPSRCGVSAAPRPL